MKLKITLLVFREGQKQGEIDLLAEYPDAIAAIRAVAQLGAANSLLFAHPDVKALLRGVGPKALARIQELMPPGTVFQIKEIVEFREEIPEALRNDSRMLYHVAASRPVRKVPPEGLIQALHDGQIH